MPVFRRAGGLPSCLPGGQAKVWAWLGKKVKARITTMERNMAKRGRSSCVVEGECRLVDRAGANFEPLPFGLQIGPGLFARQA